MEKTIDECFFQIQNGANIKQGEADGGFPITRIETIANDKFNRDRMGYAGITDIGKYESFILEDGDLLMSHINSVQYLGRTVLYEKQENETIIHGMNLLRLKARKDIIVPAYARYCFYALPFRRQLAKIIKKSVNQASFAVTDLKKIKLKVPEIEEQSTVVDKLDKIRDIIDKRTEEIKQLDMLIKARFVEMFGLPVSNSKEWPTEPMSDVAPIVNYCGEFDNEVWLLNLDMIEAQTGRVIDYLMVSTSEIGNSTCTFDESNVLYSKLRPYLNKVVIPDRCGYATSELVPLKPVKSKLNREYLTFMLRSDEFVDMVTEKVVGAKMPRVSMGDFKKFDVPIPPMSLQNRFTEFINQVDKSKVVVQKSLDETQTLFDSLMQKYFG